MKSYLRFYQRLFGFYVLVSVLLSIATATLLDFWAGGVRLWLVLVLLGTAAGLFGSMESAKPSIVVSKKLLPAIVVKMARLVGTCVVLLVTGLAIFIVHLDIWDSYWLPAFMFWMIIFQVAHLGVARLAQDKRESKAASLAQVALYALIFIELAGFGIGALDAVSQTFMKTRPLFPMPKAPVPALLPVVSAFLFATMSCLVLIVGKVAHNAGAQVAAKAKGEVASPEPQWVRIPGIDVTWTLPGSDLETAWTLEPPPDYKFLGEFGVGAILEGQTVRGVEVWLFSKAEVRTCKSVITTRADAQSFEATGEYEQVLIVGENEKDQLTMQNVAISFSVHNPVLGVDDSVESLKIQIIGWQKVS